jgi:4,5-DOPA dioxygenase extradiol
VETLQDLKRYGDEFPETGKTMPILFIGHGNPMNAIEETEFSIRWKALGNELPRPHAILCISAHWETRGTFVTAMEKPETIHDFGGFPEELFAVQYPAPGSPALAQQTKDIIKKAIVELDTSWGLDHGCWSVMRRIYPAADIPVLQLSLDHFQSAQWHYDLAKDLARLRNKGVLIIGSGNMVHNLGLVDWQHSNAAYDWLRKRMKHSNGTSLTAITVISSTIHLSARQPYSPFQPRSIFYPCCIFWALKKKVKISNSLTTKSSWAHSR